MDISGNSAPENPHNYAAVEPSVIGLSGLIIHRSRVQVPHALLITAKDRGVPVPITLAARDLILHLMGSRARRGITSPRFLADS